MPRSLTPLLAALLVVFTVHQLLTSAVAPLVSALGLTVTQLGLVFTVASITMALTSLVWGLLFDRVGPRFVLVAGLGLCVAGPAGHALNVMLGLDETLPPDLTFVLVLLFRSVLFAAGLAAVYVAASAVAGLATHGEIARTQALGIVGAAQGLSNLVGPAVGGALSVAFLWLPVYVAPVLVLVVAAVVLPTWKPPTELAESPAPVRPLELLPAFGAGFFLHLSLGMAQVVLLYLAADRLGGSVGLTGLTFASSLGFVLAQGVLVPVLKWTPARLLRIGSPVAVAGYAVLAAVPALMTPAYVLVSVGVGLAITGFAATASLGVGARHQGLIAGLVGITSGLASIIGPTLTSLLYGLQPLVPVIAAGIAAALAFVPVGQRVLRFDDGYGAN